jgi:membrane protein
MGPHVMHPSLQLVKRTFQEFAADHALRLSAALAYYSVYSIGPLLIIVIAVAGLVFGDQAVRGEVEERLRGLLGAEGAATIESMVLAARRPGQSGPMALVGLGTLLFGATGVFGQLKDALNAIWGVEGTRGGGWRAFLRNRFLSFAMVLGLGFLLLISLVLSTIVEVLGGALSSWLHIPEALARGLDIGVSLAFVALLFAMIFKVLPDVHIAWRDVWIGAIATALLFALGKWVLTKYLGREGATTTYGAAGAVVVVLSWVYYSSVILLLGAEFTQVWARRHGRWMEPTDQGKVAEPPPKKRVAVRDEGTASTSHEAPPAQ